MKFFHIFADNGNIMRIRLLGLLSIITCGFASLAQDSWQRQTNYIGGIRYTACGFAVNNIGFILTGSDSTTVYSQMWAWSQKTGAWTRRAPFTGGPREGASAVSVSGLGYMMGGKYDRGCYLHKRIGGAVCGAAYYSDLWQYTPETDTWIELTSCPGSGRAFAVAVADEANATIYYGTGSTIDTAYLSDWWAYSIASNTWSQLPDFPGGQLSDAVGFFLNGNVFIGTGYNDLNSSSITNGIWEYNPTNSTWTQVADLPGSPRCDATAFVIGTKAFICLGRNSDTSLSDMWMYNPLINSWQQRANFIGGAGYSAVGFTVGTKGYVGTGVFNGISYDCWEYSPLASDTGTKTLSITEDATINVFPVPGNGQINISYSGLDGQSAEIDFIDILGNILNAQMITGQAGKLTFNESGISKGVYFCRLIIAGQSPVTKKILVEN